MVRKQVKANNRKLSIKQAVSSNKKIKECRLLKNAPPKAGTDFHHIKNKIRRQQIVHYMQSEKKKIKSATRKAKKAAEARGEHVEKEVPRTTESMREADETIVPPDDSEVEEDEGMDEFESYFSGDKTPKILMTTERACSKHLMKLMKELIHVIPNCFYYPRRNFKFKNICKYAASKGFTDVILFQNNMREVTGMFISHLPNGPTSFWRLTRVKLGQDMKEGGNCNEDANPELILNNFTTRLGRRLGRQFAALFPQKPDFLGRRTVTFHNQRDFVFFRHYRYIFRKEGTKCGLQEIGPRFTLKCRYLQHGTFDGKEGEYEFIWRPDLQTSRKRQYV